MPENLEERLIRGVKEALADYEAANPARLSLPADERTAGAIVAALARATTSAAEGVFNFVQDATGLSADEINVDWRELAKGAYNGAIKTLIDGGHLRLP